MVLQFRALGIPVRLHIWFLLTGAVLWHLMTSSGEFADLPIATLFSSPGRSSSRGSSCTS